MLIFFHERATCRYFSLETSLLQHLDRPAISLVGSQIVQFALVWYLTEQTGSATVLATATLVAMLPMIVFGPFAGALVDRWNRRLVMICADGAVALVSLWAVEPVYQEVS